MIIAGVILLISYIFIIIEKWPKTTIAMLGASTVLAFGLIPKSQVFEHVDFTVIFLLVSMMIIVNIAGRSGMFKWFAFKLLNLTKGKPKLILIMLALFTAVLSAFLDNVSTVIIVLPITFAIAKELDIDPTPFLITEIIASNIGGTATLIGDPPNIIIGSAAGFTFMDFVKELTPIISIIFVACTALLLFLFRKELAKDKDTMICFINFDHSKLIKDKNLMIRCSIVLALVILGFVFQEITHIEAYVIALFGASVLLLFEKPAQIIQDVDWTTIFFFIGLFIIIGGFEETGGIKFLATHLMNLTKGNLKLTTMIVLWGSGFLSAIIDNIPYTVTMVPLIKQLNGSINIVPLWWALSLGACLGGNATIIGAAANVIIANSSKASGYPISFFKFFKYGLLTTLVSLALSSIYIYIKFII